MKKAEIIGKRAIGLTHGVVNTFILVTIMLLLTTGFYVAWDNYQVLGVADASNYSIFKPTAEDEGASFEELQAINPDVFAWLTVFGTGIDYPVVQGPNNMHYVSRNVRGEFSMAGSIFLDTRSCRYFTHFSSIFYGHHMARNAMFGEIESFVNEDFFNERRYGVLYFAGENYGLEFFAFLHTDAHNREIFRVAISESPEQQEYLNLLLSTSINVREDVLVTTDDRLVLLSTCSAASTNGRDILIGRIIDEVPDDPFIDAREEFNLFPLRESLPALWAQASFATRAAIVSLGCLLVLLLIFLLYRRRAKKCKKKKQNLQDEARENKNEHNLKNNEND